MAFLFLRMFYLTDRLLAECVFVFVLKMEREKENKYNRYLFVILQHCVFRVMQYVF